MKHSIERFELTTLFLLAAGGLAAAASIDLAGIDRPRVLAEADVMLFEDPVTVTAATCPRSAGGPHDLYSEGDYWWPDPKKPDGPYIRRDGLTNPDNFIAHRRAMVRFSRHVATLTAAWRLTGATCYSEHARLHLATWFIDPDTRMAPHLLYAQAIKGRATGRGIGIIDTIHLVEVARAVEVLDRGGALPADEAKALKDWFAEYVKWMTTHPYGIDEGRAANNHGTCWVVQVGAFARLTGNEVLQAECRRRYKEVLLPGQMAEDGSFPKELTRTKPYGYSLFNLDAMAAVCQILSTPQDDLWSYTLPDGRGMKRALEYMVPFIEDKSRWPRSPDVMHWDDWPVRHPSLLFGGLALGEPRYLEVWKRLPALPRTHEGMRNLPIRTPLLWIDDAEMK